MPLPIIQLHDVCGGFGPGFDQDAASLIEETSRLLRLNVVLVGGVGVGQASLDASVRPGRGA
ncbi:hypothetical protein, partial [Streptomyces adustus]